MGVRVLVGGRAEGPYLGLAAPVCFWGGLDPATGRIADPRHPDCGTPVGGTVLGIPAIVGSSSSSQLLLECLRLGTGPAAILLGAEDVILAGAVLVAREMGYGAIPVLRTELDGLVPGRPTRVEDARVDQK